MLFQFLQLNHQIWEFLLKIKNCNIEISIYIENKELKLNKMMNNKFKFKSYNLIFMIKKKKIIKNISKFIKI